MNNDPLGLNAAQQSISDVADQFKLMQQTLLVFCGIVAIGLVLVGVAIYRQSSN